MGTMTSSRTLSATTPTPPSWMDRHRGVRAVRDSFAFRVLIGFSLLYFARPEDVVPFMRPVPLAKILGGVALIALISESTKRHKVEFPLALKLLLLLFAQLCLCIPFAYWRGGAFTTVFSSFGKGVIVAILISMVLERISQLRKLIFVQAAAVCFMSIASIAAHHTDSVGRLTGVTGGVLENPNDLAINIAINIPFCLAFLLRGRGPIRKGIWAIGLIIMVYAVTATYSRSGFLALLVGVVLCLWEFGVKGRRWHLLLLAGMVCVGMIAFAPPNYAIRLQSIFFGRIAGANDNGSAEARTELLQTSLQLMAQHPLVGVGPGNFPVVTGSWKVAHNTYTQMGAEGGIPALLLFLLVLVAAFRSVLSVRRSALYKQDKDAQILAGGLVAAFGAYLTGAFFSDTAYNLFPYFLIAYAIGVRRVADLYAAGQTEAAPKPELWKRTQWTKTYARP
jgi:O-antigen ligase